MTQRHCLSALLVALHLVLFVRPTTALADGSDCNALAERYAQNRESMAAESQLSLLACVSMTLSTAAPSETDAANVTVGDASKYSVSANSPSIDGCPDPLLNTPEEGRGKCVGTGGEPKPGTPVAGPDPRAIESFVGELLVQGNPVLLGPGDEFVMRLSPEASFLHSLTAGTKSTGPNQVLESAIDIEGFKVIVPLEEISR